MGTVNELAATIDPTLVWELYGLAEGKQMEHIGTFGLDNDASKQELLEKYGENTVVAQDLYKAYVLVYIKL